MMVYNQKWGREWYNFMSVFGFAYCVEMEGSWKKDELKRAHYKGIFTLVCTKGHLISECLFDFLNFPKNHRKIWQISAQESKKWSNQQSINTFL